MGNSALLKLRRPRPRRPDELRSSMPAIAGVGLIKLLQSEASRAATPPSPPLLGVELGWIVQWTAIWWPAARAATHNQNKSRDDILVRSHWLPAPTSAVHVGDASQPISSSAADDGAGAAVCDRPIDTWLPLSIPCRPASCHSSGRCHIISRRRNRAMQWDRCRPAAS